MLKNGLKMFILGCIVVGLIMVFAKPLEALMHVVIGG